MTFWNEIEHHVGAERMSRLWLADPDVRRAVNLSVSGSETEWPLEWFARAYRKMLPFRSCAVIGCGTGALERDLVMKEIVRDVIGVDVASEAIAFARAEAERSGMAARITYEVDDAAAFLARNTSAFDALFFHGSLHHLNPVAEILTSAKRALRPGGLLYVDEYVGPSMHQWTWWRLVAANLAYYAIVPRALRRPRLVRAPRNADDPTEMIDAASILPSLRRTFTVVAERGYGGNILGVVYPNLRCDDNSELLRRSVRRLIRFDRALARLAGDHYAVVVALNEPSP